MLARQEFLAKRIASAPKIAFAMGYNNKRQCSQWRCRLNGKLHVLREEDDYEAEEGAVPVEIVRDLVPNKVVLVRRIDHDRP